MIVPNASLSQINVPDWLSSGWPGIAAIAHRLHDLASRASEDFSQAHAAAIRRLATDERMKRVWTELFKRTGGMARAGDFVHPAAEARVRANPHWVAVEGLSNRPDGPELFQELACMELFAIAAGTRGKDYRSNTPPKVRTMAEVAEEVRSFKCLAESLRVNAKECARLGQGAAWSIINDIANFIQDQADSRAQMVNIENGGETRIPNPWIVQRKSRRIADPVLRGAIVDLVLSSRSLFNGDLPGIVAIMASVTFEHEISEATVRGTAGTGTTRSAVKRGPNPH